MPPQYRPAEIVVQHFSEGALPAVQVLGEDSVQIEPGRVKRRKTLQRLRQRLHRLAGNVPGNRFGHGVFQLFGPQCQNLVQAGPQLFRRIKYVQAMLLGHFLQLRLQRPVQLLHIDCFVFIGPQQGQLRFGVNFPLRQFGPDFLRPVASPGKDFDFFHDDLGGALLRHQ